MTLTPEAWGANNILLAKLPHGWRAWEQSHSGLPWGLLQLGDVARREGSWRRENPNGGVTFQPRWGEGRV